MQPHVHVTSDPEANLRLVAEYDVTPDSDKGFTARLLELGYSPPSEPKVKKWAACVVYDDDGRKWLAWDASAVEDKD